MIAPELLDLITTPGQYVPGHIDAVTANQIDRMREDIAAAAAVAAEEETAEAVEDAIEEERRRIDGRLTALINAQELTMHTAFRALPGVSALWDACEAAGLTEEQTTAVTEAASRMAACENIGDNVIAGIREGINDGLVFAS